jgi:signal transduction histidine kinase
VRTIRGEDEVANLQRGFNQMADLVQTSMTDEAAQRDRAEQALIANRDLVANVSHELRTPVALIRGHLEAIEADPDARDAYIRIALREADRLEHLVDDLFQLTRLESKRVELDLAPFDAGSAVRSAVESLMEPARREAGLTVKANIPEEHLSCLGDRLRVEQVLLNLIRNAIHFTPEGGIILVTAERGAGGRVFFSVRDTGVGIPEQHLEHIFDRFYRADESRARSSGGAGLGLAIAKELVEAMGGAISVESELDEGTVFTIALPAAPAANGVAFARARAAAKR